MKGLVRGISFEQADTVLIMRFQVTQAATISGVQTGDRTIEINVNTGKKPKELEAEGPAAGAGGLPPPTSRRRARTAMSSCYSNMPTSPKSSGC